MEAVSVLLPAPSVTVPVERCVTVCAPVHVVVPPLDVVKLAVTSSVKLRTMARVAPSSPVSSHQSMVTVICCV